MNDLSKQRCIPCEGGVKPLTETEAAKLLTELRGGWQLVDGKLIQKFQFRDFKSALAFVNQVGDIAEQEWHHPDIVISFNKVNITLYTHSIKGLSKNDFIVAAKVSELFR